MPDLDHVPTTAIGKGMLCPVCKVDLLLSDRQGIEIDYCPQCRGVWLDRGELDKIIERSEAMASRDSKDAPSGYPPQERLSYRDGQSPYRDQDHGGGHHGGSGHGGSGHGGGGHGGNRRGGFLSRLFD